MEYQIKMTNKKNVGLYVFYSVAENCFRVKAGFKSLGFEVSVASLEKAVFPCDFDEKYVINGSVAIVRKLS
jgi:hypothetical protein